MAEIIIPEKMRLIVVAGEFQSGKDLASRAMVEESAVQGKILDVHSTSSTIKDFAETDEGQEVVANLEFDGEKYNPDGSLVRGVLLRVGYWLQNQQGEDYLTRQLIAEAVDKYHPGIFDGRVINGIRRPAEADLARKLGLDVCWIDIAYLKRSGNVMNSGEIGNPRDFWKNFLKKTQDEEDDLLQIRDQANVFFDNNYSKEVLRSQINAYLYFR